jgi:hypothetical protein
VWSGLLEFINTSLTSHRCATTRQVINHASPHEVSSVPICYIDLLRLEFYTTNMNWKYTYVVSTSRTLSRLIMKDLRPPNFELQRCTLVHIRTLSCCYSSNISSPTSNITKPFSLYRNVDIAKLLGLKSHEPSSPRQMPYKAYQLALVVHLHHHNLLNICSRQTSFTQFFSKLSRNIKSPCPPTALTQPLPTLPPSNLPKEYTVACPPHSNQSSQRTLRMARSS